MSSTGTSPAMEAAEALQERAGTAVKAAEYLLSELPVTNETASQVLLALRETCAAIEELGLALADFLAEEYGES